MRGQAEMQLRNRRNPKRQWERNQLKRHPTKQSQVPASRGCPSEHAHCRLSGFGALTAVEGAKLEAERKSGVEK